MTIDDTLRSVLAEVPRFPQCKTCRFVREGKVTDEYLMSVVAEHGAPAMATTLSRHYDTSVSADSIRNHLASHVA
jgi:hypothetical protein